MGNYKILLTADGEIEDELFCESFREAFNKLEQMRKKGTVIDYDAELASYREEKYGK